MNNSNDLLSLFIKANTTLPSISGNPLLDFIKGAKNPPPQLSSFLPPISLKPKGIPLKIVLPTPKNETELSGRIKTNIQSILRTNIELIQAQKVPAPLEVASSQAKVIKTSVLHVDMRKSSQLLDIFDPITALRVYKIFHAALVAVARYKNGRVRTFAGDRIGVVFDLYKERQRSVAVETAILMEDMLENVVNPILLASIRYTIQYGIGVDYGEMFVGKVGLSGADNNDLAWVGKAMNRASKMADITEPGIYITDDVFNSMAPNLKNNSMMWAMPITNPDFGIFHKWIMKL